VKELPIIDITDLRRGDAAARARVAGALRTSCLDNGFFYISGHGIDPALQSRVFELAAAFFALPLDVKRALDKARSPARRGYDPMGGQALQAGMPPDLKEGFFLGLEGPANGQFGQGPNQWPADLSGFRAVMEAYIAAALELSRALYRGLALSLNLPETWFDACMEHPMPVLRLLHYPPQAPRNPGDALGCGEHTDFGGLTLLLQDPSGGLQVRDPDGWIDAPPIEGTYVVNLGDMIARWSNNRYRSTMHRVVNLSGRDRYSVPFFSNPDPTALITCLPTCLDGNEAPAWPPITVAEHFKERYRSTMVA
jgi:isopenicillin N synthase-like dioxygenase